MKPQTSLCSPFFYKGEGLRWLPEKTKCGTEESKPQISCHFYIIILSALLDHLNSFTITAIDVPPIPLFHWVHKFSYKATHELTPCYPQRAISYNQRYFSAAQVGGSQLPKVCQLEILPLDNTITLNNVVLIASELRLRSSYAPE